MRSQSPVQTTSIEWDHQPPADATFDVVYTWVDDTFPGYREQLNHHARSPDDHDPDRTRDNLDLLKYSLRSLLTHLSGVRHIWIVTMRPQVPSWLRQGHPRLHVIHHDQMIAPRYLPTFNSFAIASHLHVIPGLSDPFLYVQDDMLFSTPCGREDFEDRDGHTWIYMRIGRTQPPEDRHRPDLTPWNLALAQNNHLLDQAYGFRCRRDVDHVPLWIRKSHWQAMLERWPEEVEATRSSPFRAGGNITPEHLYCHYLLHEGLGRSIGWIKTYSRSFYHGLENNRWINLWATTVIPWLQPRFLTLNDNFGPTPKPEVVGAVRRFLESRHPIPSCLEIL